jgi:hypothetical protein
MASDLLLLKICHLSSDKDLKIFRLENACKLRRLKLDESTRFLQLCLGAPDLTTAQNICDVYFGRKPRHSGIFTRGLIVLIAVLLLLYVSTSLLIFSNTSVDYVRVGGVLSIFAHCLYSFYVGDQSQAGAKRYMEMSKKLDHLSRAMKVSHLQYMDTDSTYKTVGRKTSSLVSFLLVPYALMILYNIEFGLDIFGVLNFVVQFLCYNLTRLLSWVVFPNAMVWSLKVACKRSTYQKGFLNALYNDTSNVHVHPSLFEASSTTAKASVTCCITLMFMVYANIRFNTSFASVIPFLLSVVSLCCCLLYIRFSLPIMDGTITYAHLVGLMPDMALPILEVRKDKRTLVSMINSGFRDDKKASTVDKELMGGIKMKYEDYVKNIWRPSAEFIDFEIFILAASMALASYSIYVTAMSSAYFTGFVCGCVSLVTAANYRHLTRSSLRGPRAIGASPSCWVPSYNLCPMVGLYFAAFTLSAIALSMIFVDTKAYPLILEGASVAAVVVASNKSDNGSVEKHIKGGDADMATRELVLSWSSFSFDQKLKHCGSIANLHVMRYKDHEEACCDYKDKPSGKPAVSHRAFDSTNPFMLDIFRMFPSFASDTINRFFYVMPRFENFVSMWYTNKVGYNSKITY